MLRLAIVIRCMLGVTRLAESALNSPMPNYRFAYLLQKALEFCNELKSLGGNIPVCEGKARWQSNGAVTRQTRKHHPKSCYGGEEAASRRSSEVDRRPQTKFTWKKSFHSYIRLYVVQGNFLNWNDIDRHGDLAAPPFATQFVEPQIDYWRRVYRQQLRHGKTTDNCQS